MLRILPWLAHAKLRKLRPYRLWGIRVTFGGRPCGTRGRAWRVNDGKEPGALIAGGAGVGQRTSSPLFQLRHRRDGLTVFLHLRSFRAKSRNTEQVSRLRSKRTAPGWGGYRTASVLPPLFQLRLTSLRSVRLRILLPRGEKDTDAALPFIRLGQRALLRRRIAVAELCLAVVDGLRHAVDPHRDRRGCHFQRIAIPQHDIPCPPRLQ